MKISLRLIQCSFGVGSSGAGLRARPEWKVFGEPAQAVGNAESLEVVALLQVVAGVVRRHPVRDRIDVQLDLLRRLRLADEHLAGRNKTAIRSSSVSFR
jgi:hypothetical protein